jgi:hypothetical protein
MLHSLFSFPNPVNEVAARLVAAMTLVLALAIIATGEVWLLFVLGYEFLARVLTGPTLSPMGSLATKVLAPRIGNRPVPGPPKRFAQSVGLAFSATALVLYFVTGSMLAPGVVLGVLSVFAGLEAFVGFCAGCFVFNYLMRWGLIPEAVCLECAVAVRGAKG